MYLYLNGNIVRKEEAVISPFDHGYMYGLGLFETFRMYDGHPFLLDDHLQRLQHGLGVMNINLEINREDIHSILTELLAANDLQDAYVRLNISAGVGDLGLQVGTYEEPTMMILMKKLPNEGVFPAKQGKILRTVRNTPESEIRLKSHHYLNNILAKQEIGKQSHTEGIFLTAEGYVAEGIVSNIFWVKNGVLYTPAVETGILDGITRKWVMALAKKRGIKIEEGFYPIEKLLDADEAFVTNSIQEIVPLNGIEDVRFLNERVVPSLINDYKKHTHNLERINELG
ncbi:aminodeoxychorismate lyase [Bacillus tianshenii]|nr:aminodeoxychorismate lyase [Bacillus tianshenii]